MFVFVSYLYLFEWLKTLCEKGGVDVSVKSVCAGALKSWSATFCEFLMHSPHYLHPVHTYPSPPHHHHVFSNLEKKHMELFLFLSSHVEQSHEEGQQSPGLMTFTITMMILMNIMMMLTMFTW